MPATRSEVSRSTGIPLPTLRLWESQGLLPIFGTVELSTYETLARVLAAARHQGVSMQKIKEAGKMAQNVDRAVFMSALASVVDLARVLDDEKHPRTAEERFMSAVESIMERRADAGRPLTFTLASIEVAERDPALYREFRAESTRGTKEYGLKMRLLAERARGASSPGSTRMLADRSIKPTWRHVQVLSNRTEVTAALAWARALDLFRQSDAGAAAFSFVNAETGDALKTPSEIDWSGGGRDDFEQHRWRLGLRTTPPTGGSTSLSSSATSRFLSEVDRVMRDEEKGFSDAALLVANRDAKLYDEYTIERDAAGARGARKENAQ